VRVRCKWAEGRDEGGDGVGMEWGWSGVPYTLIRDPVNGGLEVEDPGNGEPGEWGTLGVADRHHLGHKL